MLAEEVGKLIDGKVAGNEPDAAGLALRLFDGVSSSCSSWMLPTICFEQVFDGDQAGDAAVLVDDDAHVLLFALHLAQQLVAALGFRDEDGRALDAGDGACAGFLVGDLQQVVGEGDAGNVVERAGVDGNAGEVVFAQQLEKLLEGDGSGNGEDSGAGS